VTREERTLIEAVLDEVLEMLMAMFQDDWLVKLPDEVVEPFYRDIRDIELTENVEDRLKTVEREGDVVLPISSVILYCLRCLARDDEDASLRPVKARGQSAPCGAEGSSDVTAARK
jgi:hypothetical protein